MATQNRLAELQPARLHFRPFWKAYPANNKRILLLGNDFGGEIMRSLKVKDYMTTKLVTFTPV